jgi:phosphopantothenoylcysteine synthetase/decarboxylase
MIPSDQTLRGKCVLVLGGSPREAIDGVRHYANRGLDQAHGALTANTLAALGATVTLVTAGATSLGSPNGVQIIGVNRGSKITSTKDLLDACEQLTSEHFDAVLQLASIPAIVPAQRSDHKLKVKDRPRAILELGVRGNVDFEPTLRRLFPKAEVSGYDSHQRWFGPTDCEISKAIRAVVEQYQDQGPKSAIQLSSRSSALARELEGWTAIVTSGPTVESITDSGDVITNFSSGRQGHAIAEALATMGAKVVLVSGPTHLTVAADNNIRVIDVVSAQEMHDAVFSELPADIFVGVAAVGDFSVLHPYSRHLKEGECHTLQLRQNPDILRSVGTHPTHRPSVVVGFAAETQDILRYARDKLDRKGADFICANLVGDAMIKRSSALNDVTIVSRSGYDELREIPKTQVGEVIGRKISELLNQKRFRL